MQKYVALVPVKPPALGKSRLVGLADDERRALAAAFALDTVAACLAAISIAEVLVATDDAAFSVELAALGAVTIPDGVGMDLNGTLRQSAAEARRRWPELVPVALTGDLPALRAEDLDEALGSVAPGEPAYVADTDGLGTTLYTAAYDAFDPRFGPGSALAHDATGAKAIWRPLPRLRRDVDDLAGPRRRAGPGRRPPDSRTGRLPGETARPLSLVSASSRPSSPALLSGPSWPVPSWQEPSWPGPASRPSWPEPSSRPSWPAPSWPGPSSPGLLGGRLLRRASSRPSWPAPSSQEPSWPAPSWRGLLGRCFLAAAFFAGAFLAGAFLAAFLAVFFVVVFFAGAAAAATRATGAAASSVSFGSFFAPDTMFFRSWPAVNLGTWVAFALIRSPVRGLRTMRAFRTRFSNEPKPVIATFSPLATSRLMVSRTDSSA